MSPLDLPIGKEETILSIKADNAFKSHLHALGISRGSTLRIESVTLLGGTYQVNVNNETTLAFRREELERIEVVNGAL